MLLCYQNQNWTIRTERVAHKLWKLVFLATCAVSPGLFDTLPELSFSVALSLSMGRYTFGIIAAELLGLQQLLVLNAHCCSTPSSACTPSPPSSAAAAIYCYESFWPSSSCSSSRFYYSAFCICCMAPPSSASSSTGSMSCLGVSISCPPIPLALAPIARFLPFPLPFLPPRLYRAVSSYRSDMVTTVGALE